MLCVPEKWGYCIPYQKVGRRPTRSPVLPTFYAYAYWQGKHLPIER